MTGLPPQVSVIICSHNPRRELLTATLSGLRNQTLSTHQWELIVVDNASQPPIASWLDLSWHAGARIQNELQLGLTSARHCGLAAAQAELAILVDDDNVLAPDYLETVVALFNAHPEVGALGGKVLPKFSSTPPEWTKEFYGLLALRDLGEQTLFSHGLRQPGATRNEYPAFAPFGAGMALRRAAWVAWFEARRGRNSTISDRQGNELTSSGDNDIVLCAMQAGWEVAYFPTLSLIHLIPDNRLEPDYLARLNRGIQKSWMQVLTLHDANPWPPLSPLGARLRQWRAWFTYAAWQRPAGHIRWSGAAGHFAGRVPPSHP